MTTPLKRPAAKPRPRPPTLAPRPNAPRLAALLALALAFPVVAQAAVPEVHPRDRAEATEVVRGLRRIVTPNGIEEAKTIRIGGIDQFVTIRGRDRKNPVLLVLHG